MVIRAPACESVDVLQKKVGDSSAVSPARAESFAGQGDDKVDARREEV